MYRVLLTNPIHPRAEAMLREHAEVVLAASPTPSAIFEAADGCDGIIVRAQLPDGIFESHRSLRAAVRHGTGVDFIPIPEATRQGVVVANVPGVNATSVAEHATLAMLGLARRGFRIVEMHRQQGWSAARDLASQALEVHGCTVGIVGFGSVGRKIAAIWQGGFGARILVHSPQPGDLPSAARLCSLEELASAADFVVLACPLTDETRGLVDERFLARMKPEACLINVARGPLVVQSALIQALREGRIAGAALDVYETHPLDPASPLLTMPQVVATPHCAGISAASMEAMGVGAVKELLRVLRGAEPVSFINPEVRSRRRGAVGGWL